jgi:hypothetical protein
MPGLAGPDITPPLPVRRPEVPVLKNMPSGAINSLDSDPFLTGSPIGSSSGRKNSRSHRTYPLDIAIYLGALGIAAHAGGLKFTFVAPATFSASGGYCSLHTWLTYYSILGLGHRLFRLGAALAPEESAWDDDFEDDESPDLEETSPLVSLKSPMGRDLRAPSWQLQFIRLCEVITVFLAVCFFVWWCVGVHAIFTTTLAACQPLIFPTAAFCLLLQGCLYFALSCMVSIFGPTLVASLDGGLLRT